MYGVFACIGVYTHVYGNTRALLHARPAALAERPAAAPPAPAPPRRGARSGAGRPECGLSGSGRHKVGLGPL